MAEIRSDKFQISLGWFCCFSFRRSLLQEQIPEKWYLHCQYRSKQDWGVRIRNNGLSRPLQKHIFQVTVHFVSSPAFRYPWRSRQPAFAPLTVCLGWMENFPWWPLTMQATYFWITDSRRGKEHLADCQMFSHMASGRALWSHLSKFSPERCLLVSEMTNVQGYSWLNDLLWWGTENNSGDH